jgi:hypothetical protein
VDEFENQYQFDLGPVKAFRIGNRSAWKPLRFLGVAALDAAGPLEHDPPARARATGLWQAS